MERPTHLSAQRRKPLRGRGTRPSRQGQRPGTGLLVILGGVTAVTIGALMLPETVRASRFRSFGGCIFLVAAGVMTIRIGLTILRGSAPARRRPRKMPRR